MDEDTATTVCGEGCGCIFCAGTDQRCGTCGATIGGGCPHDTEEERAAYVARHPEQKEI